MNGMTVARSAFLFFALWFAVAWAAPSAVAAPQFKKETLILGKAKIQAEIADTEEKREYGLMNRPTLKDSEGMLFVFDQQQPLMFWMKDTQIPLSIGFFNESGKLFQILDMEPASVVDLNPPVYKSFKPGKFALEVPKGWFNRKKIKPGEQLKVPALHIPDR